MNHPPKYNDHIHQKKKKEIQLLLFLIIFKNHIVPDDFSVGPMIHTDPIIAIAIANVMKTFHKL